MKATTTTINVMETTPLLAEPVGGEVIPSGQNCDIENQRASPEECEVTVPPAASFTSILALLMVGVFVANADTSLVLATYGDISSEFEALESSGWLLTGYMLAMCGAQPLYGKLSNIYGRKALLLVAYLLFNLGTFICGISTSMAQVIVGRLIGGAGGAGMSSVVSFLVADIVPLRDVASYRSYLNIVQTVGRSCGGPIGGALAEGLGWRWSFLIQCPLTTFATVLVWWRLQIPQPSFNSNEQRATSLEKLLRIDFLGAFTMCAMIVTFLLPLSVGGNQFGWSDPAIPSLFGASATLAVIFGVVETRIAKEPIFPLFLLRRRDVVLPYLIIALQNLAQTFMMFIVPLYFQITNSSSPSSAGFYLIPAVIGNTTGGLISGIFIKRYARYKLPTLGASVIAGLGHTLLTVRWTGNTGIMESLYSFPGGVGTGLAHSSTFIALTAGVSDEELAIAGSGLYLCGSIGSVLGVTLSSTVLRAVFLRAATSRLSSNESNAISKALTDVRYVQSLSGGLRDSIVASYVDSFRVNFGMALLCCMLALVIGIFMKERKLS